MFEKEINSIEIKNIVNRILSGILIVWIVIDEIKGNDLRDMTDKLAKAAAHSI